MQKSTTLLLAVSFLAATPALAGNLTFDNGQTTWHSTQCVKPSAPNSLLNAQTDTAGDDMNALMSQHNAYVDAAQAYMNCVSNESDHDQSAVNQAITASAQNTIAEMQSAINADAQAMRDKQR